MSKNKNHHGNATGISKKKAIPVRKLIEMEKNNQLGKSRMLKEKEDNEDVENKTESTSSILGSLERLVETSFRPSSTSSSTSLDFVAQQVMAAKRAFGAAFNNSELTLLNSMESNTKRQKNILQENIKDGKEEHNENDKNVSKKAEVEKDADGNDDTSSKTDWSAQNEVSNTELKFLKYSELDKELSGR